MLISTLFVALLSLVASAAPVAEAEAEPEVIHLDKRTGSKSSTVALADFRLRSKLQRQRRQLQVLPV